jgi:hypothetical protein
VLRVATAAIVFLHLGLLAASLPDYFVGPDSAFHVALARQYGEHGAFFWDTIHYAPAHRPNLQGPALHVAVGALGRLLGGTGDDYIRANALVGLAGWLAAVGTVASFARRYGGERAMLLAVATLSGGAFASGSFRVNIPSGWMFVVTPWAIHAFLERRLILAASLAALACYTHLGGFVTAPVGLAVAALLAGRLRDLVRVGLGIVVLTAPYWVHVLRSLPWYVGQKGDTAWMLDPLLDLFWVVGVLAALRAPRRHAFLLAWAAAPIAWTVQDASRFVLQSPLAGSVLGAVAIGGWLDRWRRPRARAFVTAALVVLATVAPLGVPALGGEVLWLVRPYPRMLDWREMGVDAEVVRRADPLPPLVLGFGSWIGSAMAVWVPEVQVEKGHWVEVRPPTDPADDASAADKLYILAIPPDDAALAAWAARGWLTVLGGGEWSSVVRFGPRPPAGEALDALWATWVRDAAWIAAECEANVMGAPDMLLDPREVPRRRAARRACQARMTRLQTSLLLYGYSIEPTDAVRARRARHGALALGWMAALVADESTLDFRSPAAHAAMRAGFADIAAAAAARQDLEASFARAVEPYLGAARGSLF